MKEFRSIVSVHPVLLFKADLFELEKALKEDVSWQPDSFHIHITFDDCTIEHTSFESLFAMDLASDSTDKMSITVRGWTKDRDIDRGVSLTLHHNYVDYQIHSNEEGWYLAKIRRLNVFFAKRKPWYAPITRLAPFLVGLALPISVILTLLPAKADRWEWIVAPILLLITTVILGWLSYKERVFPYVRIVLKDRPQKAISYELLAVVISALALIVSIVGNIIIPLARDD